MSKENRTFSTPIIDNQENRNSKFKALINASPDPIVIYDTIGKTTYMNPAFEKVYGYTSEEFIGKKINFVPEDELEKTVDAWKRTLNDEKVYLETRRYTKAGKILNIQISTAMIRDKNQNHLESIVIHRDITPLKQAEQEKEKLITELMKAKIELEKLARVDTLTALYNRRVFDEVYEKEFSLAQRMGNDFSLLMIDVDFFKKFNDRYGHQKGDDCLQAISSCMQKNAQRITDTLARYGGEEFAIIMVNTNTENALILAERIRKDVEGLSIPHDDSIFGKVTISLGLATIGKGAEISHAQFFEKADNALYKAKETGRNKIANIS